MYQISMSANPVATGIKPAFSVDRHHSMVQLGVSLPSMEGRQHLQGRS